MLVGEISKTEKSAKTTPYAKAMKAGEYSELSLWD
jgi:hypothetical protein